MAKKLLFTLKVLIIFAIYFFTAKFGLSLDAVGGFATLVWLPTGISLSALLIFGLKFWPAISLGAFLANLTTGAPLLAAIGISLGNTLEALIGTYLLTRIGVRNSLYSLKDVLGLIIFAAIISTLISATLGVTSLWLGRVITLANYFNTWSAWWVGDIVSDLVIAPFILVWSVRPNLRLTVPFKRIVEGTGLALSILIANFIIYKDVFIPGSQFSPRAYMIFPSLIWAALRFGTRGAVTATFVLSIISLWITSLGFGPFASKTLHQSLLSVQIYMWVMSVSALILAAIANERKEVEERKDEFISIASHELKTPITTIKGYTQILNQLLRKNNKNLLSYTAKMDEQLNRLTKLVNDLLDVSKIQVGKLQLQKERVEIGQLIEDVIADLQLVNKHKIIFERNGKELVAWIDRYYITEVLINLVSNAIKYSPKSDKVIIRVNNNHHNIVVNVEDFGIGISQKDKEKIFQKFFRADNRIRQSFSGLGLGLYISSEIIKQHDGRMWVDSIKGKGTTVSFKLPKESQ